jgi:competence protein ComEA
MDSPATRWLAIVVLVIAVGVVGVGLALGAPQAEVVVDGTGVSSDASTAASGDPAEPGVSSAPAGLVVVDVDGAVLRPGLVTLPVGSRVGDALAAAGGFSPAADARSAAAINLAAPVADGDQISVPDRAALAAAVSNGSSTGGQTGAGGAATQAATTGAGGPIDLDRATATELETLPGIGPVTAGKILAARDEVPFAAVDDLLSRKLVGPATFEKIKGLVTADGR